MLSSSEFETDLDLGLRREGPAESVTLQGFSLQGLDGAAAGRVWHSVGERLSVGSHPSNDVVIEDRTVSRFHCELTVTTDGVHVRDLESRNGTFVVGVRVVESWLRPGDVLQVGRSALRFEVAHRSVTVPLSPRTAFGSLVGTSVAMRGVFALLEACVRNDATVLIEGETGTGKDLTAESIHAESARRDGPFVVVDCGAISPELLESELFGHERGAFTGASEARAGAFEAADGGTVFLDEVGELPPALQPKILRVLEDHTVRRLGSNQRLQVNVRVLAATNRRLREEVNEGRFRPDLYYRLAVMHVVLPPLRQRLDDLPVLVKRILHQLSASPEAARTLADPDFVRRLERGGWPGNVRELKNYLENCLAMQEIPPLWTSAPSEEVFVVDAQLPYAEAKRRAMIDFKRRYVSRLLHLHDQNVSRAAKGAGIDRVYLHRLMRSAGVRRGG